VVTVILGAAACLTLPIAQYPEIVPPEIQVRATYTGADAETVEHAVATPIEQQVSGVDYMDYMTSVNAGNGQMTLRITFDVGSDPNMAQILTQIRVSQATAQLPAEVNQYGVTVVKSTSAPLMLISLSSPNDRYDNIFLANYAYI